MNEEELAAKLTGLIYFHMQVCGVEGDKAELAKKVMELYQEEDYKGILNLLNPDGGLRNYEDIMVANFEVSTEYQLKLTYADHLNNRFLPCVEVYCVDQAQRDQIFNEIKEDEKADSMTDDGNFILDAFNVAQSTNADSKHISPDMAEALFGMTKEALIELGVFCHDNPFGFVFTDERAIELIQKIENQ